MLSALPIEEVLPEVRSALQTHTSAVLQAPPGAGKTTWVPLALLDEPWLCGKRIVVLEPRRLAARAAARRMAQMLGEPVGRTVGYRMHLDTCVGPDARIEVVTEGVLTRFLQKDPALDGVGAILFDEFHERNVPSDLGLALALESKAAFREDLRLLIMSATLDGASVAKLLQDVPIITSEGRSFPVETLYLGHPPRGRMEDTVVAAVRRAVADHEGDVLVFLPGAGEIRSVEERLNRTALGLDARILPLYGNLPQQAQDLAIEPSLPGKRKVVLATSIAETSLTIEGIRVVVDSGLMRVPRFSPRSGMTRLETVPVSKASADQRRGRAGRLGPGICYRLWAKNTHQHLPLHRDPEILQADLTPVVLELALWGVRDPGDLLWLNRPPQAAYDQARELLCELGALASDGSITPHGRRMSDLALHPRLAHMVLLAKEEGCGAVACDLAALLSERDVFKSEGGQMDVDLRLRLQVIQNMRSGGRSEGYVHGHRIEAGACRRVIKSSDHLRRQLRIPSNAVDLEVAGKLVALAYPDRIGQQRSGSEGRFRLRNGRGAILDAAQPVADAPFLAVAHVDGGRHESRVFLAAPLALEDLEHDFADQITAEAVVEWDNPAKRVRAVEQRRLGALVLQEAPLTDSDPEVVAAALLGGIAQSGVAVLPWTRMAQRLRERLAFMHELDPAWPDVSDVALLGTLDTWLGPYVVGMRRLDDVQKLDLNDILLTLLDWGQRKELDLLAPPHLVVPSGSNIPIDYSDPSAPVLAVRLQEVFGLTETPRIGGGRVPLVMHLLSPAHRPVQVTRDLESFWQSGYFDIRKDLRGRYPKHYWPDNPLEAEPTRRTKPRPT